MSSEHIANIMEMTPPKVIEEGIVPDTPCSPHTKKNAVIGALAAALLVSGLIVLQVVLNDTIRTEEDVERYLQLSVLSSVPERKEESDNRRKRKQKRTGRG